MKNLSLRRCVTEGREPTQGFSQSLRKADGWGEAEMALDFVAAEADWKTYAERASGGYAAQIELADFYHRRLRPQDEVAALASVARAPATPAEKFLPVTRRRSWSAFERILAVLSAQALPAGQLPAELLPLQHRG